MKTKILCCLTLLFFIYSSTFTQFIKLPVINYTNREYGRGYQELNWSIITDNRGILYAGNANGMLEFDGSSWRFIPVKQGAYVTSLAKDSSGTIFVGSEGEFGYLKADQNGRIKYHSLSDSLQEEDKFFTNIWKIYAGKEEIYFQSYENIFIYRFGEIKVLYPETSFHLSFLVGDQYYVRERNSGLMKYTGMELQPARGGEFFSDLGIFAMIPIGHSEKIFLATQEKGFFIYEPSRESDPFKPVHTSNDQFLIQSGIIGGIPLTDSNFAFNTLNEGVIITGTDGEIINIINKNSGLRVNDVKQLYQDNFNNIWCALNNGISRIDYSSPVSFFQEESGIFGSINSVISFHGLIYVGTTNGLYVQETIKDLTRPVQFRTIPDFSHQVFDLAETEGDLLAATNSGLFSIRKDDFIKISDINSFALYYQPELKLLLVGGNQGLTAFRKSPYWKPVIQFSDIREDIKKICENKNTLYQGKEIWIGTNIHGAIKLILNDDLSYSTFKYFGEFDGLNEDWVFPFSFQNSVLFGTRTGIFAFNDEETIKKALPDSLRDEPEFSRGFFEGAGIFDHNFNSPVYEIVEGADMTWLNNDNEIGYISHNHPDTIITKPFKGIDLGKINVIYPESPEICWIGAADGLIRFRFNYKKDFRQQYYTLLREINVTGDSTIFYGSFCKENKNDELIKSVIPVQLDNFIPALPFSLNNILFHFSAPFYDNEQKTLYAYMLDGYEDEYTQWKVQLNANYTNLHEGKYSFYVKAMNIYGQQSEPAKYSFTITAPWYRTTWAIAGYFILFVLFVYGAIQVSLIRLRRKNERLEQIVKERTTEIRAQNVELSRQKKEITDSIHYAQRIQKAVLPTVEILEKWIPDYFILFKPRDIVSGDFYWHTDAGDKLIVVAADCTGHGVPGAFMSMLGVSFLNKIVNENRITNAGEILNRLRENIIAALKQRGIEGEQKDGMDMALCVIDLKNKTMEFAGAHNSLYMIRGDDLNETKADRMPVAYYTNQDPFTSHIINLTPGDRFYMFSDGYADQFGGPEGKKFKYKALRDLLIEIKEMTMPRQKEILDKTLSEWMKGPDPEGKPFEQVDDILVVGIQV